MALIKSNVWELILVGLWESNMNKRVMARGPDIMSMERGWRSYVRGNADAAKTLGIHAVGISNIYDNTERITLNTYTHAHTQRNSIWRYVCVSPQSIQNNIYRVVPGVSSPRIVPGWMYSLLWSNVWYHSAGAKPFLADRSWPNSYSTLATAVGGERSVWFFGVPIRNWSSPHEIIRTWLTFTRHHSAGRQVSVSLSCNVRGANQCTSLVHMRNSQIGDTWVLYHAVLVIYHLSCPSWYTLSLKCLTIEVKTWYEIEYVVNRQTGRPTDKRTDRLDKQTGRQTDRWVERDWVVCFIFGWEVYYAVINS